MRSGSARFDITRSPTLTTHTTQLTNTAAAAGRSRPPTSQGPSGDTTSPGAPTLPLDTTDVDRRRAGAPRRRLQGRHLHRHDRDHAAHGCTGDRSERRALHLRLERLLPRSGCATVNYLGGLADGSSSTQLVRDPGAVQVRRARARRPTPSARTRASACASSTAETRRPTARTRPALAAPPTISRVDATVDAAERSPSRRTSSVTRRPASRRSGSPTPVSTCRAGRAGSGSRST